jgi:hypothetical protein
MTAHYVISVIPDAQKQSVNRLIAMIEGEDILLSENISQPASSTGATPVTHWFGGRGASSAWLQTYQNLTTSLPAPVGGWPLIVSGNVVLTEAQAQAAAGALFLNVTTDPTVDYFTPTQAQQNFEAVCASLGIQRVTSGLD